MNEEEENDGIAINEIYADFDEIDTDRVKIAGEYDNGFTVVALGAAR